MKVILCIIAMGVLMPVITIARPPGGATPTVQTSTVYKGPVGNTRDDLERYHRSAEKGQRASLVTMVKDQRIFLLPAPTRIKVLDKNLQVSKVRVLEGKHKNKTGWVNSAAIAVGAQKAIRTPRISQKKKEEAEMTPDAME